MSGTKGVAVKPWLQELRDDPVMFCKFFFGELLTDEQKAEIVRRMNEDRTR